MANNTLQTLDRGLKALEIVSEHSDGISIADLAERLDIHRAIAYRIVATLASHGLITRTPEGPIRLGAGTALLASRFEPHLRAIAQPLLQALARATRATAFISVAQGEECVVLMVAESGEMPLQIGYRVGSRHPLTLGAAGIAILAERPPHQEDGEAIKLARQEGYSLTHGQLQRGAVGVASAISSTSFRPTIEACVGVVAMEDLDKETAITEVKAYAQRIAELIAR